MIRMITVNKSYNLFEILNGSAVNQSAKDCEKNDNRKILRRP